MWGGCSEEERERAANKWERDQLDTFSQPEEERGEAKPQPKAVSEEEDDAAVVDAIAHFLWLLHVQHLEPAFIAQYRKEQVGLTARWVTLRARWVTLKARWVTLRALGG